VKPSFLPGWVLSLACIAAVAGMVGTPVAAIAADIELQGRELVVSGMLDGSAIKAFTEQLASGKVRTVVFEDLSGGTAEAAGALGRRHPRERRQHRDPGQCMAACAYAFLAGKTHRFGYGFQVNGILLPVAARPTAAELAIREGRRRRQQDDAGDAAGVGAEALGQQRHVAGTRQGRHQHHHVQRERVQRQPRAHRRAHSPHQQRVRQQLDQATGTKSRAGIGPCSSAAARNCERASTAPMVNSATGEAASASRPMVFITGAIGCTPRPDDKPPSRMAQGIGFSAMPFSAFFAASAAPCSSALSRRDRAMHSDW
jgi:hypothetical protein